MLPLRDGWQSDDDAVFVWFDLCSNGVEGTVALQLNVWWLSRVPVLGTRPFNGLPNLCPSKEKDKSKLCQETWHADGKLPKFARVSARKSLSRAALTRRPKEDRILPCLSVPFLFSCLGRANRGEAQRPTSLHVCTSSANESADHQSIHSYWPPDILSPTLSFQPRPGRKCCIRLSPSSA